MPQDNRGNLLPRILPAWPVPCCLGLALACLPARFAFSDPWPRHTIDAASRGADGVRLADVNHDRLLDVITGWEEGGEVRLCLHPGTTKAAQAWPAVSVGRAPSVEDALLVDLDDDGAWDVVSACEGAERNIRIHWGPSESSRLLDASAWRTEILPEARNRMMWMFGIPWHWREGKRASGLVAGGKGPQAELGWFDVPRPARDLGQWQWHPLRPVGWIMSILASDMDGDGDLDVLFTDRKGPRSGCFWLDNPGPQRAHLQAWKEHPVGALGQEAMFLAQADLDQDGLLDVVVAVRPKRLHYLRRMEPQGRDWVSQPIPLPDQAGTSKAVQVGDMDLDGTPDLVFTCENAHPPRAGVMWLRQHTSGLARNWEARDISGPEGIKYDLVELLDLDGDGDLDVMTCEETANLGVIWYENPIR